jgi:hypothetical protein
MPFAETLFMGSIRVRMRGLHTDIQSPYGGKSVVRAGNAAALAVGATATTFSVTGEMLPLTTYGARFVHAIACGGGDRTTSGAVAAVLEDWSGSTPSKPAAASPTVPALLPVDLLETGVRGTGAALGANRLMLSVFDGTQFGFRAASRDSVSRACTFPALTSVPSQTGTLSNVTLLGYWTVADHVLSKLGSSALVARNALAAGLAQPELRMLTGVAPDAVALPPPTPSFYSGLFGGLMRDFLYGTGGWRASVQSVHLVPQGALMRVADESGREQTRLLAPLAALGSVERFLSRAVPSASSTPGRGASASPFANYAGASIDTRRPSFYGGDSLLLHPGPIRSRSRKVRAYTEGLGVLANRDILLPPSVEEGGCAPGVLEMTSQSAYGQGLATMDTYTALPISPSLFLVRTNVEGAQLAKDLLRDPGYSTSNVCFLRAAVAYAAKVDISSVRLVGAGSDQGVMHPVDLEAIAIQAQSCTLPSAPAGRERDPAAVLGLVSEKQVGAFAYLTFAIEAAPYWCPILTENLEAVRFATMDSSAAGSTAGIPLPFGSSSSAAGVVIRRLSSNLATGAMDWDAFRSAITTMGVKPSSAQLRSFVPGTMSFHMTAIKLPWSASVYAPVLDTAAPNSNKRTMMIAVGATFGAIGLVLAIAFLIWWRLQCVKKKVERPKKATKPLSRTKTVYGMEETLPSRKPRRVPTIAPHEAIRLANPVVGMSKQPSRAAMSATKPELSKTKYSFVVTDENLPFKEMLVDSKGISYMNNPFVSQRNNALPNTASQAVMPPVERFQSRAAMPPIVAVPVDSAPPVPILRRVSSLEEVDLESVVSVHTDDNL